MTTSHDIISEQDVPQRFVSVAQYSVADIESIEAPTEARDIRYGIVILNGMALKCLDRNDNVRPAVAAQYAAVCATVDRFRQAL